MSSSFNGEVESLGCIEEADRCPAAKGSWGGVGVGGGGRAPWWDRILPVMPCPIHKHVVCG